jgi:hypothetical protein
LPFFSTEKQEAMSGINEASPPNEQTARAIELSSLVDLEARWENLRTAPLPDLAGRHGTDDLLTRQKAYEAFHAKLTAYNDRYKPPHIPELLLNTPARLAKWCDRMRSIYLQVESHPRAVYPIHLLEKTYRWADRIAVRLKKPSVSRSTVARTIRCAIEELEAVGKWCDEVARIPSSAN